LWVFLHLGPGEKFILSADEGSPAEGAKIFNTENYLPVKKNAEKTPLITQESMLADQE
jgi:hypothetical protein